jgi:hypothetical protein
VTVGEAAAGKSVPVRCAGMARNRSFKNSGTSSGGARTGQGPTWIVHGRRQRRGRVLGSPNHAAVAIKARRSSSDWAERLYSIARWSARIGRSARARPRFQRGDALPAHLSIRHWAWCCFGTGKSPAPHRRSERGHEWRWQTARPRPAGPAHLNVDAVRANQRHCPPRFHARRQMPQLRRCGGDGRPCTATSPPCLQRTTQCPALLCRSTPPSPPWRGYSPARPFGRPPPRRGAPPHHDPNKNRQNPHAAGTAQAATTVVCSQSRSSHWAKPSNPSNPSCRLRATGQRRPLHFAVCVGTAASAVKSASYAESWRSSRPAAPI